MKELKQYKLLILDAEHVAQASFTPAGAGSADITLTPHLAQTEVGKRLAHLRTHHRPQMALVACAPQVGLRLWLEANGREVPPDYPSLAEAEGRLAQVARQLGIYPEQVYLSLAHKLNPNQWVSVPSAYLGDLRFSRNWPLPRPGMLLQAMAQAGVKPDQVLFVGHSLLGRQAAGEAKVDFVSGAEFYLPQETSPLFSGAWAYA